MSSSKVKDTGLYIYIYIHLTIYTASVQNADMWRPPERARIYNINFMYITSLFTYITDLALAFTKKFNSTFTLLSIWVPFKIQTSELRLCILIYNLQISGVRNVYYFWSCSGYGVRQCCLCEFLLCALFLRSGQPTVRLIAVHIWLARVLRIRM